MIPDAYLLIVVVPLAKHVAAGVVMIVTDGIVNWPAILNDADEADIQLAFDAVTV